MLHGTTNSTLLETILLKRSINKLKPVAWIAINENINKCRALVLPSNYKNKSPKAKKYLGADKSDLQEQILTQGSTCKVWFNKIIICWKYNPLRLPRKKQGEQNQTKHEVFVHTYKTSHTYITSI